jgi:phosphoserine phosphatase/lysophospholipase L1-like esterase
MSRDPSTVPSPDPHSPHPSRDEGPKPSSASAVWVPLIALGLLGAAVWFGTSVPSKPEQQTAVGVAKPAAPVDPLPSWNDGPTKRAILDFLAAVTREGSSTFVPVAERIAVFDHDGTLVCEKPIVHGMFLIDRIRALAERQPEIAHEEPFATLLTGDIEFVRKLGKKFLAELTFTTLAGVPEERLEAEARDFIRTARHPVFDVPFGETTYQPMRELIAALKARGFSVWICSGSGIHFMRPAAEEWYKIGPEHVIASRPVTVMREVDGVELKPEDSPNKRLDLVVLPELRVLNDEERKPVSIGEQIGRRPIFVAGNVGTGGDIDMLRWSQSGDRPSLQLLVLHDDAEREMAYGEPTNASLEAAKKYGWQVVRMAADWKAVFARPLVKKAVPPSAPPAPAAALPLPAVAAEAAAAKPVEVPPPVRWDEEIAAFEKLDQDAAQEPGGICLLGSSNIRMWTSLAEDFPGMNVVNRGVGGCRLAELTEYGPRLVAAAKPRVIVVSAGTNDIAAGLTAEEIRDEFGRLVASLRRELPDAKIAFLAIAPSIKRWEQMDRQRAANDAIRSFVDSGTGGTGLAFIDANEALLGPDGKPAAECFLDDQQHPSTIGNARRAAIMRPQLKALLGD